MSYSAKVILDSISPDRVRLTTLEVTFPRFILAEFNTHRVFSRNSASSRAIPIKKMIQRVIDDPVYPLEWGKNQPGMQAGEEISEVAQHIAKLRWAGAADSAVGRAETLSELGVHKQIVNRILEPFLWHTVLVTSTEWENFFEQRLSFQAQPEMREIAGLMSEALESNLELVTYRPYGNWHLPFITHEDRKTGLSDTDLMRVSIARCARVSYLNHDGKRDLEKDLELYEKLVTGKHLSPFEHVARPSDGARELGEDYGFDEANFRGWRQARWNLEKGLPLAS